MAGLTFIIAALLPLIARADVLELKTGERIEGAFHAATSGAITIRVGNKKLTFKRGEIRVFYFGEVSEPSGKVERIAKAEAGARRLARAVSVYSSFTGDLPDTLAELTSPPVNVRGEKGEPLLTAIPDPPCGWSVWTYATRPDGSFTITTTGDGVMVSVP